MRFHPILLVIVGVGVAACDETGPSGPGTLVIATTTGGNEPDPDGYLLTIDGDRSLALDPTGTAEAELPAGRHSLRLLGVAEYCAVASATALEVDVPPGGTTSVGFEISCQVTGARITTTSTGLDVDPNGFHVVADGADRGPVGSNGSVLTQIDPGSRTISLTAVAANCTIDGPSSRSVTIVESEVTSIEFEVSCTAMTGVIGIVVRASGIDVEGDYTATIDGGSHFRVGPGSPTYVESVLPGDHVVSLLAPTHCSVATSEQSVAVTAGELMRDTVEISFSVSCVMRGEALRIAAPTTGPIPTGDYSVWSCLDFYCYYWDLLGHLAPNDTLVARVPPGQYVLELRDIPSRCSVQVTNPTPVLTLAPGDTLDVELPVACSP